MKCPVCGEIEPVLHCEHCGHNWDMQSGFEELPRDEQIYKLAVWGVPYNDIAGHFGITKQRVGKIANARGYHRPHKERRKP